MLQQHNLREWDQKLADLIVQLWKIMAESANAYTMMPSV